MQCSTHKFINFIQRLQIFNIVQEYNNLIHKSLNNLVIRILENIYTYSTNSPTNWVIIKYYANMIVARSKTNYWSVIPTEPFILLDRYVIICRCNSCKQPCLVRPVLNQHFLGSLEPFGHIKKHHWNFHNYLLAIDNNWTGHWLYNNI